MQLMSSYLISGRVSYTRKSCQTVLAAHLLYLVRAIAPIMPHLAEDIWQNLPFQHTLEDGSINYLRPDLKRGSFSQQEEDAIVGLHEILGNRYYITPSIYFLKFY